MMDPLIAVLPLLRGRDVHIIYPADMDAADTRQLLDFVRRWHIYQSSPPAAPETGHPATPEPMKDDGPVAGGTDESEGK